MTRSPIAYPSEVVDDINQLVYDVWSRLRELRQYPTNLVSAARVDDNLHEICLLAQGLAARQSVFNRKKMKMD